ncbi:MAG: TrmB family transcriptional regulator [Thermoanaerobaculia bacterium]
MGRTDSGPKPLTGEPLRPRLLVAMATSIDEVVANALQELGFSEIEALVYGFLVQGEAATGYRISHAIGKPTANTYKAIASLVQQGAVQVDEGGNRLIRAVPPDELLAGLERRAREKREAARAALAQRSSPAADERVYTLRARDQVFERARAMLGRATEIVLGDLFPGPLDLLATDLEAARARGARVVVKTYGRRDLIGIAEVVEPDARRALVEWPGQQLSLVVDAEEHLLALFDPALETVHQAVWSRSTFLSCLHHNHIAMELLHTAWKGRDSLTDSDALVGITLLSSRPPGLRRLQERVGQGASTNLTGGTE